MPTVGCGRSTAAVPIGGQLRQLVRPTMPIDVCVGVEILDETGTAVD